MLFRSDAAPRGAASPDRLLREEDRVERDGFGESHAQDGLDEDLAGRVGIATHGLDGLGADETHADGGGEAASGGREGTGDFSDDHVCVWCGFFSASRLGVSRQVACIESERSVGVVLVVTALVVADEADVDGREQGEDERLDEADEHLEDAGDGRDEDRKSTRLNSSHTDISRMPSSA